MPCVTWHCRKCGTTFRGTWLTQGCKCGNRKFANITGTDGQPIHSPSDRDIILSCPEGCAGVTEEICQTQQQPTGV